MIGPWAFQGHGHGRVQACCSCFPMLHKTLTCQNQASHHMQCLQIQEAGDVDVSRPGTSRPSSGSQGQAAVSMAGSNGAGPSTADGADEPSLEEAVLQNANQLYRCAPAAGSPEHQGAHAAMACRCFGECMRPPNEIGCDCTSLGDCPGRPAGLLQP